MLTVISDLHLTDGSSGTTINGKAFEIFANQIVGLAKQRRAKSFELVLLGDIFDLIRSEQWTKTKVRPWDKKSVKQEDITINILDGILKNNTQALNNLRGIIKKMPSNVSGSKKITYIMGNHDWLINRYPKARKMVRTTLGLSGNAPFQHDPLESKKHRCVMRHGDYFDSFNYMKKKGRDASSLGDALVIEFLGRFPLECAKKMNLPANDPFIEQLREIDNIRPYGATPVWIISLTRRMPMGTAKIIRRVFIDLYREFIKNKFVKQFNTWSPLDIYDKLRAGWLAARITGSPLKLLEKLGKKYNKVVDKQKPMKNRHVKGADKDRKKFKKINYVVYGHTHNYHVYPLDRDVVDGKPNEEVIYFNSGTWRKQFEQTLAKPSQREFVGYHVLTYISFYSLDDGTSRNYEVWDGVLGE
jgi:UDP-2,3-diacylglucosamine pyrophosphatase LpxH